MKTVSSEISSGAVDDCLYDHAAQVDATLFTFYLLDGTDIRRWTDAGVDISYGGNTWLAGVVGIKGGMARSESGLAVSTYEIEIAGTIALGGAPLTQAALSSTFDGVRVLVQRIYFDGQYPATAQGLIVEFDGTVMGREPGSLRTKLIAKSATARAEMSRGLRVIGSSCAFSVYDADCGATVQEASATVAAGSTTRRVNLASVPATGQTLGSRIRFTSGALNGVQMLIRAAGSGYVDVDRDLPQAPAAGVSCVIRRGCDLSRFGCHILANDLRFGGAPAAPDSSFMLTVI